MNDLDNLLDELVKRAQEFQAYRSLLNSIGGNIMICSPLDGIEVSLSGLVASLNGQIEEIKKEIRSLQGN